MWVTPTRVLLWVMWVTPTQVQINPASCSRVFAWAIVWAVWGSSRGSSFLGVVGHVGHAHAAHHLYSTNSCIYNYHFLGLDKA